MRLSDVMSALHLSSYAEVAMVIFLTVFVAIAFDLYRHKDVESARLLPFDGPADPQPESASPSPAARSDDF